MDTTNIKKTLDIALELKEDTILKLIIFIYYFD